MSAAPLHVKMLSLRLVLAVVTFAVVVVECPSDQFLLLVKQLSLFVTY